MMNPGQIAGKINPKNLNSHYINFMMRPWRLSADSFQGLTMKFIG